MPVPGDYNENIPQATDQLSVSQGDLLNNFGAIYALVGVNHVNFDAGSDAGKHKFCQFPTQSGNPGTTTTELALYAKNSYNNPSVPALYIQKSNNATVANGGFTEYAGGPGAATNGWTRTAAGILLKWGFEQTSAGAIGTSAITFPVLATIPVFTDIFMVLITPAVTALNPNRTVYLITNPTTTGFTVYQPQATNCQFYYLALGV